MLAIYQAGLDTGDASFETTAPTWDDFDQAKLPPAPACRRRPSPGRCSAGLPPAPCHHGRCTAASSSTPSTSIPTRTGRGIGAALLGALTGSTEAAGIWTIQTGIFPENTASLRLHQQAGFRRVGTRQRIGCHHGRWRDVTLLERRSTVAGT